MSPTDDALQAWRAKVWSQLREADQANYATRMALMRDRKAQLEAELMQFDALTRRKMEREEIMKSVLQWLLGPTFALMPDSVLNAITPYVDDKVPATGAAIPSGTYAFPEIPSSRCPRRRRARGAGDARPLASFEIQREPSPRRR